MTELSIIIPVYNVGDLFRACLDSIVRAVEKAGCGNRIEVLLADDGSADGCERLCDEAASAHAYFRVLHLKNGGAAAARNAALRQAAGDYIGWIDADDLVRENWFCEVLPRLADCVDILVFDLIDDAGNRIAYGRPGGAVRPDRFLRDLIRDDRQRGFLCNKVFRREFCPPGVFDESLEQMSDFAAMYAICRNMRHIVYLPITLYVYRVRTGSITNQFRAGRLFGRFEIALRRYKEVDARLKADALSCAMYHAFYFCHRTLKYGRLDGTSEAIYRTCAGFVRRNLPQGLADCENRLRRKVQFLACALGLLPVAIRVHEFFKRLCGRGGKERNGK